MIHGATPGNMIDAQDIRDATVCECGRIMHMGSSMCQACRLEQHNEEQRRKADKAALAEKLRGHHLWTDALEAGWETWELTYLAHEGWLPTREEIEAAGAAKEWGQ